MRRVRCPISPLVAVLRDLYGRHVFPAKLSRTATQAVADTKTCGRTPTMLLISSFFGNSGMERSHLVDSDLRRLRTDYVWLKIESCLTFASVAEARYELRMPDAERFLADGELEYLTLVRLFSETDLPIESKSTLQSEIDGVRHRLNEVKHIQRLRAHSTVAAEMASR